MRIYKTAFSFPMKEQKVKMFGWRTGEKEHMSHPVGLKVEHLPDPKCTIVNLCVPAWWKIALPLIVESVTSLFSKCVKS